MHLTTDERIGLPDVSVGLDGLVPVLLQHRPHLRFDLRTARRYQKPPALQIRAHLDGRFARRPVIRAADLTQPVLDILLDATLCRFADAVSQQVAELPNRDRSAIVFQRYTHRILPNERYHAC